MTETVSLVQLQEAWQKLTKELAYYINNRYPWTMIEEFGVLLQRLITELPRQAKTIVELEAMGQKLHNEMIWKKADGGIGRVLTDEEYRQRSKAYYSTFWVALEALVCEGKNHSPKKETKP